MPPEATPDMLFATLLATLPIDRAAQDSLRRRMTDATRHYHDHRHVGLLWSRYLAHGGDAATAEERRRVACAIAFHDAIYDPRATDNEARSAALWRRAAATGDLAPAAIEWVAGTIEATADHLAPLPAPDAVRQLVLDLDLTPLGEPPAQFAHNAALLRAEYAHLPEAEWRRGRVRILARFLAAPRLYRTPSVAATYEAQARANLSATIAAGGGPSQYHGGQSSGG